MPSSNSSRSTPERGAGRVALIACGALAQPAAAVVDRNAWPVDVHPLPPLLHNHPHQIAETEAWRTDLLQRLS